MAIGGLLVVAAVLIGLAMRSFTRSELWLDEALTVNIARLPLGDMFEALRRDGHPPLYYLLLHFWMELFGDGNVAVRMLSTLFSAATLPLAWLAGSRAGRRGALAALVLTATSPFAIRYGSEARMYALVMFLVAAGWVAVQSALDRPTPARLVGVAVVSGLLLLTHYWCFYLLVAVVAVLGWRAWRSPVDRSMSTRVAVAALAGLALFAPWAAQFVTQVATTGTPWGEPIRPGAMIVATLATFGGEFGEGLLISFSLLLLALLGLFGLAADGGRIELELRTRPGVRGEAAVIGVALALAVVGSYLTAAAFAGRYSSIVFPLFILMAAHGLTRLPSGRVFGAVLGVVAVLGLSGGVLNVIDDRTQADDVAAAIQARATPGDLVVYCPDQLGPAVTRLLGANPVGLTFPDAADPERVNWTDYVDRNGRQGAADFARQVVLRAEGNQLWLVWRQGYRGLGTRCEELAQELGELRGRQEVVISPNVKDFEHEWLYRFAAVSR